MTIYLALAFDVREATLRRRRVGQISVRQNLSRLLVFQIREAYRIYTPLRSAFFLVVLQIRPTIYHYPFRQGMLL